MVFFVQIPSPLVVCRQTAPPSPFGWLLTSLGVTFSTVSWFVSYLVLAGVVRLFTPPRFGDRTLSVCFFRIAFCCCFPFCDGSVVGACTMPEVWLVFVLFVFCCPCCCVIRVALSFRVVLLLSLLIFLFFYVFNKLVFVCYVVP